LFIFSFVFINILQNPLFSSTTSSLSLILIGCQRFYRSSSLKSCSDSTFSWQYWTSLFSYN